MTGGPQALLEHLRVAQIHAGASGRDNFGKMLLWSNFVAIAVQMLRDAERELNDPEIAAPFKARRGWHRGRPQPNGRGPDEDAVTDALVELMRRSLDSARLGDAGARLINVGVFSQQKRRKQAGIGAKGRLNTDIAIYLADQTALDLRIEAKVLVAAADVASSYCSADGLLRFADPKNPYTIEHVGGMVAYCFVTPRAEWDDRVSTAMAEVPQVRRSAKVAEGGGGALLVTDVANPSDLGLVTVFHIGLQFATGPVDNEWRPTSRGAKPQRARPKARPTRRRVRRAGLG